MSKIKRNSPAEEAAIQAGIADDPDAAELGDEFFGPTKSARRRGIGSRLMWASWTLFALAWCFNFGLSLVVLIDNHAPINTTAVWYAAALAGGLWMVRAFGRRVMG